MPFFRLSPQRDARHIRAVAAVDGEQSGPPVCRSVLPVLPPPDGASAVDGATASYAQARELGQGDE